MVKQQEQDSPLLNFKSSENNASNDFNKIDENSEQYKSDAQQLTEDSMWLAELYQGVQNGEPWALQAARDLQVADSPDKNDNSTNAQLLRSNNELATAIKAMVSIDKKEK